MVKIKYYTKRILETKPRAVFEILKERLRKYYLQPHFYLMNKGFIKRNDKKLMESIKSIETLTIPVEDLVKSTDILDFDTIEVLGFGQTRIPSGMEWRYDPFFNKFWPDSYFNKIKFVDLNESSDIKVVWELNRLQFLLKKACIAKRDSDTIIVKKIIAIFNDWKFFNPVGYGPAWICSMEVSIRAINLLLTVKFLFELIDCDQKKIMVQSLKSHYEFIQNFPELSDIPGNHYLTNIATMIVLERSLYGETNKLKALSEKLIDQINRQFYDDGGHFENSPTYHLLCLELLLITNFFLPKEIQIQKMNKILRYGQILFSAGKIPIYGDNDSGEILKLKNDHFRKPQYLILKTNNHDLKSNIIQFFGNDIFKSCEKNLPNNFALDLNGYLISKKKTTLILLKHGPPGLMGRASHDHDDILDIKLVSNGVEILVDEGCKSYSLNTTTRLRDIISSSHNLPYSAHRERLNPKMGSIHPVTKGAAYGCNQSVTKLIDSNILYSEVKIDNTNDLLFQSRELKHYSEYNIHILDSISIRGQRQIIWRWRFNSNNIKVKPRDNHNTISAIINIEGTDWQLRSDSSCTFSYQIERFNYGNEYGNIENQKLMIILKSESTSEINLFTKIERKT